MDRFYRFGIHNYYPDLQHNSLRFSRIQQIDSPMLVPQYGKLIFYVTRARSWQYQQKHDFRGPGLCDNKSNYKIIVHFLFYDISAAIYSHTDDMAIISKPQDLSSNSHAMIISIQLIWNKQILKIFQHLNAHPCSFEKKKNHSAFRWICLMKR